MESRKWNVLITAIYLMNEAGGGVKQNPDKWNGMKKYKCSLVAKNGDLFKLFLT